MQLDKLALRNFMGMKHFILDTEGRDANIFGDNATGKTTLFSAFTWLLFGKDSLNRQDFEIKTLDQDGKVIPGLDHEVEATINLYKSAVMLRKVYAEKYTKKRGSSEKEFTGHETQYYIDGVPVQKKDYEQRIASIIAEERFKLLTNPRYFNEVLHWQDRRRILLEVCGDVSDTDVIASNERLSELPAILGNHSLEDYRKIVKARHTEINKELIQIPIRIDEATRSLLDKAEIDVDGITNEIDRLEQQRTASLTTTPHRAKGDILTGIERARAIIETNAQAIQKYEEELQVLRAEWGSVNAEAFTAGNCPTCGQTMPEDRIDQFRNVFDFNKKQKLSSIRLQGEQAKARKIRLEQESYDKLPEIDRLEQELNSTVEPVDVSDIQSQIDQLRAKMLNIKQRETTLQRIEDLKAQEKALAKEYTKLERELYLTEEFIRTKISLLTDKINGKFTNVKFKLFNELVNGGLEDCCVCTVDGVPYDGGLNNSARICAGCEIISVLQKHYGITVPCWVDNNEAICHLPPMDCQIIGLFVSANDPVLRVETVDKGTPAVIH